jgi:dihydrofolate reductase
MIKAILACDMDMGIGKDGTLPWPHNKEDLKHFQNLTTGHVVVMGSKTWDDPFFPGPLKDRINIVISSNPDKYFEEGADHALTSCDMNYIKCQAEDKDIWIIGGASIYKQFSDVIEEWHVTLIQDSYDCDTFIEFPPNLILESYDELSDNKYIVYKKEK